MVHVSNPEMWFIMDEKPQTRPNAKPRSSTLMQLDVQGEGKHCQLG